MSKCLACGSQGNGKFCPDCGKPMMELCANCRQPLEADARFCSQCGTPVVKDGKKTDSPSRISTGDVGVIKGTIDTSVHTTIGQQTNYHAPVHLVPNKTDADELLRHGKAMLKSERELTNADKEPVSQVEKQNFRPLAFILICIFLIVGYGFTKNEKPPGDEPTVNLTEGEGDEQTTEKPAVAVTLTETANPALELDRTTPSAPYTPVPTVTPTRQPFEPVAVPGNPGNDVQAASISLTPDPPAKDVFLVGNIVVCIPSHLLGKATIHLWRLSVDWVNWDPVEPWDIPGELRPDGTVKIDGLPIDSTSWGYKGQPYRMRLLDGEWKSIGDDKGFIVRPNWDNRAPNTFCESTQQ